MRRRIHQIIFIYGTLCLFLYMPAYAQSPEAGQPEQQQIIERSDNDLVLVELKLGRLTLAEVIPGYADKSGLYLPLGEVAQALMFNVTVNPQEGVAEGTTLTADQSFSLDTARSEVVVDGDRASFAPGNVEVHSDDIYVNSALLGNWFSLDLEFSFSEQVVRVATRDGVELPIQRELEREQAHARLSGQNSALAQQGPYPRVDTPYQLFTTPFTDVTLSAGYDQQVFDGWNGNVTALSSSDFLYMHSNLYVGADENNGLTDLRWTLSRRDPDGKLFNDLDPLGRTYLAKMANKLELREIEVGDVNSRQLPLTAFNHQSRGVMISSIPYDRATRYDRTTIEGDIQRGWEVELYRNDELLFFQQASGDGRYEFVDVPLISGLNIIRLVFYGPFGQEREEIRRFRVTPNLTEAGESNFRLSVAQQDTNSFDVLTRNERAVNIGSAISPLRSQQIRGKPRGLFEYEYGLLDNVSLFAHTAFLTTPDDVDRKYVSTGMATTIAGAYARADVAYDTESEGNAFEVLLQDSIYGVSLSANHEQYNNGFVSEHTEVVTDPVTQRTTLRADTPLKLPYVPLVNNSLTGTRTKYESDRELNLLSYRAATAISRLALSNNINYLTDTTPTTSFFTTSFGTPVTIKTERKQLTGEFLASLPYDRFVVRSNAFYGITPDASLQALLFSTEYNFGRDSNIIAQVDRQFQADNLTTYGVSLNQRFDHFLLGGAVSHNSEGQFSIGLNLSFSFGQDPRSGEWNAYPDYLASNGLVVARAYNDLNNDGVFNKGDEPVERTQFQVNRGGTNAPADESGRSFINTVQPDLRSSVTLDEKSLDDPYLVNVVEGQDVVTRPGVPSFVDFPVISSGDVEGTVFLIKAMEEVDEPSEAANVEVQILTLDGELVQSTRTGYDGYYFFTSVPIGTYVLRVSYAQADRLGFILEPDRKFTIRNNEDANHIYDMMLISEDILPAEEDVPEDIAEADAQELVSAEKQ